MRSNLNKIIDLITAIHVVRYGCDAGNIHVSRLYYRYIHRYIRRSSPNTVYQICIWYCIMIYRRVLYSILWLYHIKQADYASRATWTRASWYAAARASGTSASAHTASPSTTGLESSTSTRSCSHLRARRGRREATARACALPSPWRALARGPPPRRSSSGACKAAAEKVSCQMQVSLCYSFLPSHSQYTFWYILKYTQIHWENTISRIH